MEELPKRLHAAITNPYCGRGEHAVWLEEHGYITNVRDIPDVPNHIVAWDLTEKGEAYHDEHCEWPPHPLNVRHKMQEDL